MTYCRIWYFGLCNMLSVYKYNACLYATCANIWDIYVYIIYIQLPYFVYKRNCAVCMHVICSKMQWQCCEKVWNNFVLKLKVASANASRACTDDKWNIIWLYLFSAFVAEEGAGYTSRTRPRESSAVSGASGTTLLSDEKCARGWVWH